jgi:hypothetical protein
MSSVPPYDPPVSRCGRIDPLEYPFDIPGRSYIWSQGAHEPVDGEWPELVHGRVPVVAAGSNSAPSQLRRKFGDWSAVDDSDDASIPILSATATEIDVVFSAHVSWYGAVPATVIDSPGTTTSVFLTWLTPRQLERMNATESLGINYQLRAVPTVESAGVEIEGVLAYQSVQGPLLVNGEPLALRHVAASGRRCPAATEAELLDLLAPDLGFGSGAALVDAVLADEEMRARFVDHLARRRGANRRSRSSS